MGNRITVIGSNSFSGSHFVNLALERGYEVTGISRSPEIHPVFLPYRENKGEAFRFIQGDLNLDLERIMSDISDLKPAFVVNFAAQSMVAESWEQPDHWFQTNVMATVQFHECLRHCSFLKKYVHISTPEVYGTCEGLVQESVLYNPSTPYAVSRAAADMSLMSYHRAYDFPVVFTRAANVFGPGQQLYRIIPRAILCFLTGERLQLHGGGISIRSFIDIRDVAEATLTIAEKADSGDIFHLSTQRNISIRSLVELIAERVGVSFSDHVDIVGDRLGKDQAYLLDSTRARELGWVDKWKLEDGIDSVIDWVKHNLDTLKKQPQNYIHKP